MGTITTLRPSSTSSGVGWTATPSGTLHGVTSDDNDATYALWSGDGSPMILATPVDSPPAGERRHQVRLRARGEDGDAWWAVRLASGSLVAGAAAQFTSSPVTVTGSWGFGAPADGPTILSAYVTGQSIAVKITELYLDVDSRDAPAFTPEILDGSGTSTTTISDTSQPTIRADAVDLDELNARQYRYWVTLNGAVVWDTGIVSGTAVNRQTSPLDNGSYVAHLQVWSTLGANTSYPSDEETLAFTVTVGSVPQPDNPTVSPEDGTPFYQIEACAPFVGDMDGGVGYIEVQRVDCPVGGYLVLPGSPGAYASTPDPGPALTDLEITIKAGRDDAWRPTGNDTLIAHYDSGSDQRSWRVNVDAIGDDDPALVGRILLAWSEDGTSSLQFAGATERTPVDPYGIIRLRIRLDVDDGAGGWSVTFETRETDEDEWVQLGDVVTNSGGGTTSLFDTDAPYSVGAWFAGGVPNELFTGRIYEAQVRDGAAGAVIVNPDFTAHLDGTRSFTDTAGNLWSIHGSASIYSPTSTHTIAMLGPLETGECAEWVDFTLPRSGVGTTCDHAPVACCSYYRARTVGREDGDLRISSWSDFYDPGIPAGIIVMWPDTAASLPSGWDRVTDLDGRYAKGIATSATEPGATGGAATHTHTLADHTHDTSHSHGHSTFTGAGSGTVNSTPNSAGTTRALSSHTHTRPTTGTVTMTSQPTAPGTSAVANDPARLEVIYAESDGTPLGVPDGALALAADISLSGWTDYASAASRFFKGAAAAGNGGATAASSVDSHIHTIDAHTHSGTNHVHTGGDTSSFNSANTVNAGVPNALSATSHNHPITINAANSQALGSASGGSSGAAAADMRPPFRNVRVKENTSGVPDLPAGLICAWRGALAGIPDNWHLCDGTDGTLDLTGLYPQGATSSIGTTGGSLAAHSHTGGTHTHSTTGHAHTESIGLPNPATSAGTSTTSTVNIVTAAHTHSATDTNSTTPAVASTGAGTLASTTSEPPFEEVAFVQLMEEPTPPPDPDTFCLSWDSDEHLIRTMGPSGPLWAPVLGKFEWNVDRPFTAETGVNGSRFVTSAPPGGRNLVMTAAVESEAELAELRAVLARPLVLISPSDADEVWAAPVTETVRIVRVGRIRRVSASFIGTGPQPPPQLADVGV
jgi:hypothetical protein